MITLFLKIAIYRLRKNKFHSFLNIGGFSKLYLVSTKGLVFVFKGFREGLPSHELKQIVKINMPEINNNGLIL